MTTNTQADYLPPSGPAEPRRSSPALRIQPILLSTEGPRTDENSRTVQHDSPPFLCLHPPPSQPLWFLSLPQGHHGDAGASAADVILPGAAYTEKHATYVNTEGRVQRAKKAKTPIGDAREDWAIVRALSEVCGRTLEYDSLDGVRDRMAEVAPSLVTEGAHDCPLTHIAMEQAAAEKGKMTPAPFARAVDNFYMTNAINRSSVTMAKCTAAKQPHYDFVGAGVTKDTYQQDESSQYTVKQLQ